MTKALCRNRFLIDELDQYLVKNSRTVEHFLDKALRRQALRLALIKRSKMSTAIESARSLLVSWSLVVLLEVSMGLISKLSM
jgi:hypothetical protein